MCGLAVNQQMLVIARFVQGAGGALTSAVVLGMIVTMFPEPREQAKAIGVFAFVASAGGAVGLLAGGAITQAVSWHWIFFVNVPGRAPRWRSPRCGSCSADRGLGFARGRGRPRCGAGDQRADDRRVHDRQAGGRGRLAGTRRRWRWAAISVALLVALRRPAGDARRAR